MADTETLEREGQTRIPVETPTEYRAADDKLRLLIERIERLEEEKRSLADDVKDVFAEAKANGYDVKTMRQILKLRRLDRHARQEADALLETYRNALGL
jgi:uncharacterized protein (UPF0335 family)